MQQSLHTFFSLVGEMAPYLLLGFLVAGILHAFVPRRLYTRYLAGNDMRSVTAAALIGIPLPLCSCGVIPTAMSMHREGASRGATVSFLIATPQTGVDSIAATAALLGLPFALLRPVAALVTALGGGALVNLFAAKTPGDRGKSRPARPEEAPHGFRARLLAALHYGFVDMIRDIGRWLIVGLLIAGAITVLLPDDLFMRLHDRPLLNMLLVLAVSAPMYLCATGSIPIAAALMLKGLSPGAALVLLMAGPATNTAAMLVIGKVLGRRTLLLYLASIVVGAVGFGLAVDYLLPAELFDRVAVAGGCCREGALPLWKSLSAGVLLLLIAGTMLTRHSHDEKHTTMEQTYRIRGMMCNHCKANVERGLAALEGVTAVHVDLDEGTARVEGTAPRERVIREIERLGYRCEE